MADRLAGCRFAAIAIDGSNRFPSLHTRRKDRKQPMPQRARKLIGTVLLVAFVIVYSLTAMMIAASKLPGTSGFVQLAYYVFAGLFWVLPAAGLVWWMQKPDAAKGN